MLLAPVSQSNSCPDIDPLKKKNSLQHPKNDESTDINSF